MRKTITYAIGDIHGCHDLLIEALDWIEQDSHAQDTDARVVFLGDYGDRGLKSRQVIETLLAGPRKPWVTYVPLLGNHDWIITQVWLDPEGKLGRNWFVRGGQQTLMSYGWSWAAGRDIDIREMIPESHIELLSSARLWFEDEGYFYAHAGFRPGVAPHEQTAEDLLWIRDEFLQSDYDFGKPVVHGHTPVKTGPVILPNRINLDTGAWKTGILTCAALEPGRAPRIFQTAAPTFVADPSPSAAIFR